MMISVFGRVEKIVGENIDFQDFLLFLQLFLRAFFHKVVKLGRKWESITVKPWRENYQFLQPS